MTPEETYLKVKQLHEAANACRVDWRNRYTVEHNIWRGLLRWSEASNECTPQRFRTASWTRSGGNGNDDQRGRDHHNRQSLPVTKPFYGKYRRISCTDHARSCLSTGQAMIDVQISTAKAYPRNIRRATENAIAIVSIDKDTAATCTYSVPAAANQLPAHPFTSRRFSLKFGEPANWSEGCFNWQYSGNKREAVCFDLENNLAIKTQVKRSIVAVQAGSAMTW